MQPFFLCKKLSDNSSKSFATVLTMTLSLAGCERVTEADIQGACARLATTLKYQDAKRLEIIHELDKKSGKSPSPAYLVDLQITNIGLMAANGSPWELACREALIDDYLNPDSAKIIEAKVQQLERDAEEARRRAEELAKQSDEASLDSPELTRFEKGYWEIERPMVANIVNSRKVMQIKVAISTNDDDRVAANLEKHEFAIRSEMLDVMRKIDETQISEPNFRRDLAEQLKIATNSTLERYEDFGGVKEVMFTEFIVQ
jgi:flagellar FliL protein